MKMSNKKRKSFFKNSLIILTVLLILLVLIRCFIKKNKAGIELTQLSARSNDSMMGYFIVQIISIGTKNMSLIEQMK